MSSINNFVNQNVGLSILLTIGLFLLFFYILNLWRHLSDFCGNLWDEGWDSFAHKWKSWSILKKIIFVLMYILMILGWILFGVFMLFSVAVATGTAVEAGRRNAQYKRDIHDIAGIVRKER